MLEKPERRRFTPEEDYAYNLNTSDQDDDADLAQELRDGYFLSHSLLNDIQGKSRKVKNKRASLKRKEETRIVSRRV